MYLVLFVCSSNIVLSQFSVQTNIGIENPYNYFYTGNVTPNSPDSLGRQKFNFFRTKIMSAGLLYEYKIPNTKDKLFLTSGISIGGMNQFVADTIVNPAGNKLIFNVKHRNIFIAPEIGVRLSIYKFVSLTSGFEIFTPLIKWINSDEGNEIFKTEYSPDFYSTNVYFSVGLEFDLNILKVGLKFQTFGEADHWIEFRPLKDFYHDHDLERWVINIRYNFQ